MELERLKAKNPCINELIASLDLVLVEKPNMGTVISKNRASEICHNWHGGQWSALYSFASSKCYVDEKYKEYISEIHENKPTNAKDRTELNSLKRFFDYKHWEANKSIY
jgi:hypothetical protein